VGHVEVDQQAYIAATEADIGKKLGLADRINRFYTLNLYEDEIFDDQIETVAQFDALAVIDHGESNLAGDLPTLFLEFVGEARFVRVL